MQVEPRSSLPPSYYGAEAVASPAFTEWKRLCAAELMGVMVKYVGRDALLKMLEEHV